MARKPKSRKTKNKFPILFLGLSTHFRQGVPPFPFGAVDILGLSWAKTHFLFPVSLSEYQFLFLIEGSYLIKLKNKTIKLLVETDKGKMICDFNVHLQLVKKISKRTKSKNNQSPQELYVHKKGWVLINISTENLDKIPIIPEPGRYRIKVIFGKQTSEIGEVQFGYVKAPPFSSEQIDALQSDPLGAKYVRMIYGCNHCDKKLVAYTGLNRSTNLESEGAIWQYDLPETFTCECGKSSLPLTYAKESLHGLLGVSIFSESIDPIRRYGHREITNTVKRFYDLLKKEKTEPPIQKFIETNPVLLAQFQAKILYKKPDILGKFVTDFVILDARNQLLFIEIERPTLQLFKKDGHQTAKLMHAYGQVRDWLHEYSKHSLAILESLKLKPEDVANVKGVVVAGRTAKEDKENMKRHLMVPPYPNVDFFTYDDLANGVLQISRDLV